MSERRGEPQQRMSSVGLTRQTRTASIPAVSRKDKPKVFAMQPALAVYGGLGAVAAALVTVLARRDRISMSSETYDLNSGAMAWAIACFFFWPIVFPAFFAKRRLVLDKRSGLDSPPLPPLPTVPKMSYCIVWATMWWCYALPLYLVFLAPNFATIKTDLMSPLVMGSAGLLGVPLGLVAGSLDWWWNRKPIYSTMKRRWFNQAGTGSILAGATFGCILGLTGILPQVASSDDLYGGAFAGGVLGIAVGVVYKYSAICVRLIVEA